MSMLAGDATNNKLNQISPFKVCVCLILFCDFRLSRHLSIMTGLHKPQLKLIYYLKNN
jgi:hypothetical protein